MWAKILYGILIVIVLLGSVVFTHFIMKKIRINRWVVGVAAFLVIIIPNIIFDKLPGIAVNIIATIFVVLCVMFFEISRTMLERGEIKGILKSDNAGKK